MKRLLVALVLVLIFSASTVFADVAQEPADSTAPYLSVIHNLKTIFPKNDPIQPRELKIPQVIIVFKACCTPNSMAIKWIMSMREKYGDAFQPLGVDIDNQKSLPKARAWLESRKVDFPIFWDVDHEVVDFLGVQSTPAVLMVDENGVEIYRSMWFGGNDTKEIENRISEFAELQKQQILKSTIENIVKDFDEPEKTKTTESTDE